MAAKAKKPRNEARNQKVIASLIGSMTVGAATLLWLTGPATASRMNSPLLMAENAPPMRSATIELITHPAHANLSNYDVVIRPGARPTHTPHSADLRIAVVAPEGGALQDQKLNLLRVLDDAQRQGLNLTNVALDSYSDPNILSDPPQAATDLRQLLEQKGLLR